MSRTPLVIDIGPLFRSLDAPRLEEDIAVADLSWLPEAELEAPLSLHVSVDRVGEDFLVGITDLRGEVRETCVRCLTGVVRSFSLRRATRLFPFAPAGEDETPGLDLAHQTLDLHPFVREEVLLGLEGTPHCRADCRGLCPTCGTNLNERRCDCPDPNAGPASPLSQLSTLWKEKTK